MSQEENADPLSIYFWFFFLVFVVILLIFKWYDQNQTFYGISDCCNLSDPNSVRGCTDKYCVGRPIKVISKHINSAKWLICLVTNTLTSEKLADDLISAKNRDVHVRVVLNRSAIEAENSQCSRLKDAGVNVKIADNKILDVSFCLIDYMQNERSMIPGPPVQADTLLANLLSGVQKKVDEVRNKAELPRPIGRSPILISGTLNLKQNAHYCVEISDDSKNQAGRKDLFNEIWLLSHPFEGPSSPAQQRHSEEHPINDISAFLRFFRGSIEIISRLMPHWNLNVFVEMIRYMCDRMRVLNL